MNVANCIREHVATGDFTIKDDFERVWDEEAQEAENDIMGLSMSFLFVQALRYLINCTGLPNNQGYGVDQGPVVALWLFLAALVATIAAVLLFCFNDKRLHQNENWFDDECPEGEAVEDDVDGGFTDVNRHVSTTVTSMMMTGAWCNFYGMRWLLTEDGSEPTVSGVFVALVLSLLCFLVVFQLDKFADRLRARAPGERQHLVIMRLIFGMGILIGFAWEQCFDAAAGTLAKRTSNPHLAKLVVAVFCAFVLTPAWRWYLLPMSVHSEGVELGFLTHDWDDAKLEMVAQRMADAHMSRLRESTIGRPCVLRAYVHDVNRITVTDADAWAYERL